MLTVMMMATVSLSVSFETDHIHHFRPICLKCARSSSSTTSCKPQHYRVISLFDIWRSYVNSILTSNHIALQQQQQQQHLASQKDSIPDEQLAMIPTPRAASVGNEQQPPELEAERRAALHANEYSVACMANDHAPIGQVVKQTLAQSSTLDLTK